jgi:hypothetical protein
MPGADLITNPVVVWTDNVDNWRASDADFLQKRSVMRFATVASRTTFLSATPVAGMVTYVGASDTLQYTDSVSATANVWRTIMAPKYLATSDSVGTFGMRLASDGTDVLLLQPGKVVLGPTQALTVDTAVKVKTGAATAALTTDATALVSDVQVKAPSVATTGAVTAASIVSSGNISTATITATGNIQSATSVVTGNSSVAGVLTASSLNLSGLLTASAAGEYLRSSVVNGYQTWFNGATRIGLLQGLISGLSMTSEVGALTLGGANVVLAATAGPARYGSTTGPYIACSVASASDPGVTNYPEGTLWAQV